MSETWGNLPKDKRSRQGPISERGIAEAKMSLLWPGSEAAHVMSDAARRHFNEKEGEIGSRRRKSALAVVYTSVPRGISI